MSLLESAIGWLAPPDCLACGIEGSALCQSCFTSGILIFGERCWHCNTMSPDSKTCIKCRRLGPLNRVWITTNYEGLAQDLIRKYKFGHQRAAVDSIVRIMAATFLNRNKDQPDYLVVPVPTATGRIRERGFGHSELMAKKLAAGLGMEYSQALRRLGQTRQLGSLRADRLTQLADSFAAKYPRGVRGRNILLIDDVVTTGGSLISAAQALKLAGASRIDALVFAKRL